MTLTIHFASWVLPFVLGVVAGLALAFAVMLFSPPPHINI